MKRVVLVVLITAALSLSGCSFPADNAGTNGTSGTDKIATGGADKVAAGDTEKLTTVSADKVAAVSTAKVAAGEGQTGSDGRMPVPDNKNKYVYINLYYQDGKGYLIPVATRIPKQEGIAKAALARITDSSAAREELEYYGLDPVLPNGTRIIGMTICDGIAKVDFSRELLNYSSVINERNMIASIVYTLTEFNTVEKVDILINGRPLRKMKFASLPDYELGRQDIMINSRVDAFAGSGKSKADIYFYSNELDGER